MGMGREGTAGGETHDRSGAGDFLTDPVQHLALDPCRWRLHPLGLIKMHRSAFGEIRVDPHGGLLL